MDGGVVEAAFLLMLGEEYAPEQLEGDSGDLPGRLGDVIL